MLKFITIHEIGEGARINTLLDDIVITSQVTSVESWSPFLESPETFSHQQKHSKITNLMITELFCSRIMNINRGSLHTRSFRRIHLSVLDTDELKIACTARNVSGAFEKRAPGSFS